MSRVPILNGSFDALTLEGAADAVYDALDHGRRGWLCTLNVSTLMAMRANPSLQTFADNAMLVVADGQPLVWTAPLFGGRLPERVAGVDLMDEVCRRAAQRGRKVYLLGATERVLDRAMHTMRARYPGLTSRARTATSRPTMGPHEPRRFAAAAQAFSSSAWELHCRKPSSPNTGHGWASALPSASAEASTSPEDW